MAHASRPVVEIMVPGMPKRKRDGSEDIPDLAPEATQNEKRRKVADILTDQMPGLPADLMCEEGMNERNAPVADPRLPRQSIESQLSLEILLKHNELRLINQELAKCQTALEQLRRCHLIPYPISQGTPESMQNISNGTGPAVGYRQNVPQWAAPYGVVDGPYTRHYAKWLIPDPSFDGMQAEWQRGSEISRAGKTVPEGRSTRHSFAEGMSFASKSRSQRGSAGQKLQALPSGYAQAKEKAGPCVLKRQDGQMVKLVCIDCKRENFSSTQGFINHCRIAHRRDFKSHEEAAVASGQPIEVDEVGGIVGEEKSPTIANGLVHPLIRSAPTDKESLRVLLSSIQNRIQDSMDLYMKGKLPGITSIPTSADSTPAKSNSVKRTATPNKHFVPSSVTPHLSALMRSRGFGGDLNEIVTEAKTQIDLDDISSQDGESEDFDGTPTIHQQPRGDIEGAGSPLPPMRVPARAGVSPAPLGRPGSSKGIDARTGRQPGLSGISPRLSHTTPIASIPSTTNANKPTSRLGHLERDEGREEHHDVDVDMDMMHGPSINDLSPNTIASNNAPSLVSDDGEYDEGDDAESATSEDVEEDSDVAEIDIEDDGVDKMVPRTVLRNRSGSGSDGMRLRKEDKHVTFVSPVKERRTRRT